MTKPAHIYSFVLGANKPYSLLVSGAFFKVLSSTGPVLVEAPNFTLTGIGSGQGMEKTDFDRLTITDLSGAANTVKVAIADSNFLDNSIGGSIVVSAMPSVTVAANKIPQVALMTTAAWTLGIASLQIGSAFPARQYFMLQNLDSSANAFVCFDGAAATVARGIKIPPGGNIELSSVVPVAGIFVIGDIAGAAGTLRVMEG